MNNMIKFRGQRINNGAWVYGAYLEHQKISLCVSTEEEFENNKISLIFFDNVIDFGLPNKIISIEVNPLTVGQFTGIYDKNKKEIYVGDILSDGKNKFRVYYIPGGFCIKAPHWSSNMDDLVIGDDLIMQPLADVQTRTYIYESMEIVGNIYTKN